MTDWVPTEWSILQIVSAGATPLIAVAGAAIALSNFRLGRIKRYDAIFETRMETWRKMTRACRNIQDQFIEKHPVDWQLLSEASSLRYLANGEYLESEEDEPKYLDFNDGFELAQMIVNSEGIESIILKHGGDLVVDAARLYRYEVCEYIQSVTEECRVKFNRDVFFYEFNGARLNINTTISNCQNYASRDDVFEHLRLRP